MTRSARKRRAAAGRRAARARAAAGLLGAALLTSGCALSFQRLPVGRTVPGASYDVTADFADASQLPVGGNVLLGAATVGRVESIITRNFQAVVTLNISDGTKLPTGTAANLQLTSALGDEYVQLRPPAHAGTRLLSAGSVIPAADTTRGPDIEDTLAALGAVVNGSGLTQLKTIVTELNTALGGRTKEVRDLLSRLDTLLGTLNAHKTDIDGALTALDTLSSETASNTKLLNQALTTITPAVKSLAAQTRSFNTLLAKIPALSSAASDLVNQAGPQLDTQLNQLKPVVSTLSGFDDRLGSTLKELNTFHGLLDKAIPGDYLDLNGTLTVNGTIEKLLTTDPQCVLSRSCSTSGGSATPSPASASANKNASATPSGSGGPGSSSGGILGILGAGTTGERGS